MAESGGTGGERGVGDALRDAVSRTLDATAASQTRERAGELLDEVARLGAEARSELARRGQEAREELTRRGQEARDELARRSSDAGAEVAKRLETLERRLASLEDRVRGDAGDEAGETVSKPKAEG